jgi:hypothetical protein
MVWVDNLAENASRLSAERYHVANEHYTQAFCYRFTRQSDALFIGTGLNVQGIGVGTHVV